MIHQSIQSLSHVPLFVTPWTAAHQASLSITSSQSLHKLIFIESVMPSNPLILCCPLLLLSIFPSIRVFSNESVLHIKWPKYWSFSFGISSSNAYSGLISFRIEFTIKFTLLKCTIRWFQYVHRVVQPSSLSVLEDFHHPEERLYAHYQSLSSPNSPAPGTTNAVSVFMDLPILDNVFKVHSCYSMFQYLILFYSKIVFHCTTFLKFISWWTFGLFLFFQYYE